MEFKEKIITDMPSRRRLQIIDSLINNYMVLEKSIQSLLKLLPHNHCVACQDICCKEVFCQETKVSFFYKLVSSKVKEVEYDSKTGWLGSNGCRLSIGRPLICYDFFCEKYHDVKEQTDKISSIIKEIDKIFSKAYGNLHLLILDSLDRVKSHKLEKMDKRISCLKKEVQLLL